MFEDLQKELGLTYLFIAHDLSVVRHISNRIGVMYLGKLVELADSFELIAHSVHPYTRSLISAIPEADPKTARAAKRIPLEGDVPSPLNPPSGAPAAPMRTSSAPTSARSSKRSAPVISPRATTSTRSRTENNGVCCAEERNGYKAAKPQKFVEEMYQ